MLSAIFPVEHSRHSLLYRHGLARFKLLCFCTRRPAPTPELMATADYQIDKYASLISELWAAAGQQIDMLNAHASGTHAFTHVRILFARAAS